MNDAADLRPITSADPVCHRDRAQLFHRRDRGDEDQSDAHGLQHDHLRKRWISTVGLLDAKGNILSIGLGLPMFIRGIADSRIKAKPAISALENRKPGDILLTNDAYITGSHLNPLRRSLRRSLSMGACFLGSCGLAGALAGHRGGRSTASPPTSSPRPLQSPDRPRRTARAVQNEDDLRNHPHERAPARAGDGRSPRPDRRGQDRREAVCRDGREIRRRDAVLAAIDGISWTRARPPRAAASPPSPTASTRRSRLWTTMAVTAGKRIPIRVKVTIKPATDDRRL